MDINIIGCGFEIVSGGNIALNQHLGRGINLLVFTGQDGSTGATGNIKRRKCLLNKEIHEIDPPAGR